MHSQFIIFTSIFTSYKPINNCFYTFDKLNCFCLYDLNSLQLNESVYPAAYIAIVIVYFSAIIIYEYLQQCSSHYILNLHLYLQQSLCPSPFLITDKEADFKSMSKKTQLQIELFVGSIFSGDNKLCLEILSAHTFYRLTV